LEIVVNDKEERASFRIRKGDFEIEYEGKASEVNARYKDVMEWVQTEKIAPPPEPKVASEPKRKRKKKKEITQPKKRGGQRPAVISPAIDKMIEDGFLDDFKRVSDVAEELRRLTIPVSGVIPVQVALNRRVPKILDRIKDTEGKWVYRKKTSEQ
jgi:hypothetical protein